MRASAAVVTVSDGVSSGTRDDVSGRALVTALGEAGFDVVRHEVVSDERDRIAALLRQLVSDGLALVVTTGGTGLGPRDVTPEATRDVIAREAPGLAEAMRAAGRASTPFAALSREVVGAAGATLIVNLPGSRKGASESLAAIVPVLPHALELLAGDTVHRAETPATVSETSTSPDVDAALAERRSAGEPVVLATAVRSEGNPPCRVGQKILVGPDGPLAGTLGCAEFDAAALDGAREVLASGEPGTRTFVHELGSIEVYLEPTLPAPLLVILSATPVASALARWGREVGFDPLVVEPRSERTGVLPAGVRVIGSLEDLPLAHRDVFAVSTDHDAPGLAEAVGAMLRADAAFVGVMGSARHVGPHLEALRQAGFGDADLAKVRTPVGLSIGARSAEEIALSILAGVVAARHGRSGGWLDADRPVGGAG